MIVAHSKCSILAPSALQMTMKVFIKWKANGIPNLLPTLSLAEHLKHSSQGMGWGKGAAIVLPHPQSYFFCDLVSFMQSGLIKEIFARN